MKFLINVEKSLVHKVLTNSSLSIYTRDKVTETFDF